MGFLYLIIAIVGESIGNTIDKRNYVKNRVTFRQLMLIVFAAMFVSLVIFTLVTRQSFPRLTPISIGLLIMIGLLSFAGNALDILSLKNDDLSLREPLVDFQPILAGLVGYAFFPTERKPFFLIAFLLSVVVVFWGSHRRRLGRLQRKGLLYMVLAAIFYAFLPSIYKLTLAYVSPAYISLLRVSAILLLTSVIFPVKRLGKLSGAKLWYGAAAGIFYAVEAIVNLYAIQLLGVVLTMVFMMLGPALRYCSSLFVLKEKVRRGEVISSLLLAVIAAAALAL